MVYTMFVFPGVTWSEHGTDQPHLSSVVVKESVQLYHPQLAQELGKVYSCMSTAPLNLHVLF